MFSPILGGARGSVRFVHIFFAICYLQVTICDTSAAVASFGTGDSLGAAK